MNKHSNALNQDKPQNMRDLQSMTIEQYLAFREELLEEFKEQYKAFQKESAEGGNPEQGPDKWPCLGWVAFQAKFLDSIMDSSPERFVGAPDRSALN